MEGGAPRSWFISIGYSCAILPSSRFLNPDEHVLKRLTDPITTLYNYTYGELFYWKYHRGKDDDAQ